MKNLTRTKKSENYLEQKLTIKNIKDMPGYNPIVKNGVDSVTNKLVYLKKVYVKKIKEQKNYPYCVRHGAMLKVSKDGIWRCGELGCDSGCYYPI